MSHTQYRKAMVLRRNGDDGEIEGEKRSTINQRDEGGDGWE